MYIEEVRRQEDRAMIDEYEVVMNLEAVVYSRQKAVSTRKKCMSFPMLCRRSSEVVFCLHSTFGSCESTR